MGMIVNLYQTSNRVNDLNKKYTSLKNPDCTCTDVISPEKMELLIDYRDFDLRANYAYVNSFKRFYFVKYQINGDLVKATLECDPLMSFKNDVLNADIIAERSSSNYEKFLPDEYVKNLNYAQTKISRFKNVFETGESGAHYILKVGGR